MPLQLLSNGRFGLDAGLYDAAEPDRTAAIGAASAGAVAANAWTGFTSPAGTIFTDTGYGATGAFQKYLYNAGGLTPNAFILKGNKQGRDTRVTVWGPNFSLFMRLVDGKAILFEHNADSGTGVLWVSIVSGVNEATGTYTARYDFYVNTDLGGTVPAYNVAATNSATWDFELSGFNVFVKFNGNTVTSFKQWYHMKDGYTAIRAASGKGIRDMLFQRKARAFTHSYRIDNGLDPRDFGYLPITSTCSMTAGSNVVTLPSNAAAMGWVVGNPFIVATGGESHGGVRKVPAGLGADDGSGEGGTGASAGAINIGVGGTSPIRREPTITHGGTENIGAYANGEAACSTSTSKAYVKTGSTWTWLPYAASIANYYAGYAYPRALEAYVGAVAGSTITAVDSSGNPINAAVNTTAAPIYFDGWDILNTFAGEQPFVPAALIPTYKQIFIPNAHTIACRKPLVSSDRTGWAIRGAGVGSSKLFSPPGCGSGGTIHFAGGVDCQVSDLEVQGNAHLTTGFVPELNASGNFNNFPKGIYFTNGTRCRSDRCKATNVHNQFFGINASTDCGHYNFTISLTIAHYAYSGWLAQSANGTRSTFADGTATCTYPTATWESFQDNGCFFYRCTGTNTTAAVNSSDNWLLEDLALSITAQYYNTSFSYAGPIISIDTHQAGLTGSAYAALIGGVIRRPTIYIAQPLGNDFSGHPLYPTSINVEKEGLKTIIEGTYRSNGVSNHTDPKGLVDAPAADFNGNYPYIHTNAYDTVIRGIRTTFPVYFYGGVKLDPQDSVSGATVTFVGQVRDCVFDNASTGATAYTGAIDTITNAVYLGGG
jgi:hypothetical protein